MECEFKSSLPQLLLLSSLQSCLTLQPRSTPGLPIPHHFLKFAQVHVHCMMPSSHLILWCPLLLLPSSFAQHQGLFQWVGCSIRWPKYRSFSFSVSISPSNEYSELVSLKVDWFDLLAVQGTLRSILQLHSSKASILWCSAFFMVQLSHLYMTTGKTIALTIRTFVGKILSLLFNTLSRFIVAFLPRSNHFLISWLRSPSTDFWAQEEEICHYFNLFPFYLSWSNGARCHDLSFF